MAYKSPIWEDGKSPAISAENLNNLSQAAEGAQVLYGNSAPTSSTEGAVGQFYLVVVADSDGSYPLYQCVAIANGRYVWKDTRRIPDSITLELGLPGPGTINSALNVLAHVGNLHVWEEVQSGVTDYLTSMDRIAYPNYVTDGHGAYITYLGQLGGCARIEVGSYVGRGTYGSSNPNILTFGFEPKIVELLFRTSTNVGGGDLKDEDLTGNGFNRSQNFMVTDRLTEEYAQGEGFGYGSRSSYGKKSPDGKTFYWYSSNAANQCNSSEYVYYYIAIY